MSSEIKEMYFSDIVHQYFIICCSCSARKRKGETYFFNERNGEAFCSTHCCDLDYANRNAVEADYKCEPQDL